MFEPPAFSHFLEFIVACVVAVLCGAIIGLERESKGKPAGLRTLVLISLGSCILVQLSVLLATQNGDPTRIAAQIVSGIGFLGAGAILQKSEMGYVAGLTTAASIWVTAAIGMTVGAKEYIFGVAGTFIVVVCLRLLRNVETFLFYGNAAESKIIVFKSNFGKTQWKLLGLLEDNMIRPEEYTFKEEDENHGILEMRYSHKNRQHRQFLADAAMLAEISKIS